MNFDELQKLWNSSGNEPSSVQREKLTKHFVASLRRQRRNQLAWLIWTFFVFTALTTFVGWIVLGTDKVDLTREWAALPLMLIPWSVAILFLKRFLKPANPLCRGDVPTTDALMAAVAANRAAQSRLKIVGVMYAVFIPVLARAMWQLHAVGKTSTRELASMTLFFGAVLGVCATGVFLRLRFRLMPQQKHLESLLQQF